MTVHVIDVNLLRSLFLAGAQRLEDNKEPINMLNVFPVPDGDTGTNMSMTIQSAVAEINKLDPSADMQTLCKAISSGSLRGARGNSGVILSQLLRGFIRSVQTYEQLDAPVLAAAMGKATDTAYKAVMKPMEGTILTVARAMSDKALELTATEGDEEPSDGKVDILEALALVVEEGRAVLARTPEMLPVLKEAGVVDSGGQGLLCFMSGVLDKLGDTTSEDMIISPAKPKPAITAQEVADTGEIIKKERTRKPISTDDIKFGYCTEFLVLTEGEVAPETEAEFKNYLASIGDSIVCVSDEDIIKVHVHTNDPGLAIQKGLTYGMLSNLKIDNMRLEHQNTLVSQAELEAVEQEEPEAVKAPEEEPAAEAAETAEEETEKKAGFITVASGGGIVELFKEMGVDVVISGGQTMNPSTDDILTAIENLNADPIFILPNNKNIIMSANQARDLTEDKKVYVVPTRTVPQGITAVISFDPSLDGEANAEAMLESAQMTKSLEVTFAVRNTKIQGHKIKKGDIMGLDDGGIRASGRDVHEVALKLLDHNIDDESSVVSVFAGSDTTHEDAEALVAKISEHYPSVDVDLYDGGQPLYFYILAVD